MDRLRAIRRAVGRRIDPTTPFGRRAWQIRRNGVLGRLRVHWLVTWLLGPAYRRSHRLIEIDITYACNLSCNNCNRSVVQAPSGSHMTHAQIEHFVDESRRDGVKWERIRLLGGEPTLHKDFVRILNVLRAYRDGFSPATQIEVSTNGFGPMVRAAIARIPPDVVVRNSAKDNLGSEQAGFDSFNVAPQDLPAYATADYENGCAILKECGMGLGPSGYYPCAVAAGIDRVFGYDVGRQALPASGDRMEDQLRRFCRQCGHFKRDLAPPLVGAAQSPTWQSAYERFRGRRPELTAYGPAAGRGRAD